MPGSREEDQFYTFNTKLSRLGVMGYEIYNSLSSYPIDASY